MSPKIQGSNMDCQRKYLEKYVEDNMNDNLSVTYRIVENALKIGNVMSTNKKANRSMTID